VANELGELLAKVGSNKAWFSARRKIVPMIKAEDRRMYRVYRLDEQGRIDAPPVDLYCE
jgi:hypothetical protein